MPPAENSAAVREKRELDPTAFLSAFDEAPAPASASGRRSVSPERRASGRRTAASDDPRRDESQILADEGRRRYQAGDYEGAIECFRLALNAAPLRDDLQAMMRKAVQARTRRTASRETGASGEKRFEAPAMDRRRASLPPEPVFAPEPPPRKASSAVRGPEPVAAKESAFLPPPFIEAEPTAWDPADKWRSRPPKRRKRKAPSAAEGGSEPPAEWLGLLLALLAGLFRLAARREALAALAVIGGVAFWPAISSGVSSLLRPASQRQAEAFLIDAEKQLDLAEPAEARSLLLRAKALNPPFKETRERVAKRLAEACHALGNQAYRDRKFDQASEKFEEAIGSGGDSADLYGDLGMAMLFAARQDGRDKKKLARALEAFSKARADEPRNAKWMWGAAECHDEMGSDEMAKSLWREILEVDPGGSYGKEALRVLERRR